MLRLLTEAKRELRLLLDETKMTIKHNTDFECAFKCGAYQSALETGLPIALILTGRFTSEQIRLIKEECRRQRTAVDAAYLDFVSGREKNT